MSGQYSGLTVVSPERRGGAVKRGRHFRPEGPDGFADRLNRLFASVYGPGQKRPYRNCEVIRWLSSRGVWLSDPYLSQLRRGQRTRPADEVIVALADFFGVDAAYLNDDDPAYTARVDADLMWMAMSRDTSVRRLTAVLLDLSPRARKALLDEFDSEHPSSD